MKNSFVDVAYLSGSTNLQHWAVAVQQEQPLWQWAVDSTA